MIAWKAAELRICRALGGERRGPTGHAVSDCVGTRWTVSVKRSKRGTPERAWIDDAIAFSRREHKPWLLVVAQHNDRTPVVVLEFAHFLELASDAGWLVSKPDVEVEVES